MNKGILELFRCPKPSSFFQYKGGFFNTYMTTAPTTMATLYFFELLLKNEKIYQH